MAPCNSALGENTKRGEKVYAALGFPGAEELANMFDVQRRFLPNRLLDMIESYALHPDMQGFEKWLQKNRSRFDTQINVPAQLAFA